MHILAELSDFETIIVVASLVVLFIVMGFFQYVVAIGVY